MRQHCADKVDHGKPAMRWNPLIDKRPDFRPYGHAQPTRQAILKRQRRQRRQAKQVITDGDAYLAHFHDLWEFLTIPGYDDTTAWF